MSALPASNQNTRLDLLISKVDELAVLPHVVFKVLEISGDADSPAAEMEKAIVIDPDFSSKVLALSNSAMYALPKKVSSIKEAIMFLGFRSVRTLAMTVGVFDLFVGKTDAESLRRRTWWRHSIDTAVCARWLANETKKVNADEAYTCGLLHCIGKTLLDRVGDGDYEEVAKLTFAGESEPEAERKVFGCDHVELALGAAGKWGFPEELIQGIDYLEVSRGGFEANERRACTAIAEVIAGIATAGSNSKEDSQELIPAWAIQTLGLDPARIDTIIDQATAAIATARQNQA
jgi:HD-like signal output (HDOD) protein